MLPLHVSWACLQSGDSQGDISRKGSSWAQHLLCCCSVAQSCPLFATPWTAAHQASLSFTITQSLLKLMSIESVMLSDHLILCRPLLLLPSIFPSIRVFSNESALPIRWPKYWSFSFSISPSHEYSGLISFRVGWLDLLSVPSLLIIIRGHSASLPLSFSWGSSYRCHPDSRGEGKNSTCYWGGRKFCWSTWG